MNVSNAYFFGVGGVLRTNYEPFHVIERNPKTGFEGFALELVKGFFIYANALEEKAAKLKHGLW